MCSALHSPRVDGALWVYELQMLAVDSYAYSSEDSSPRSNHMQKSSRTNDAANDAAELAKSAAGLHTLQMSAISACKSCILQLGHVCDCLCGRPGTLD